MVEANLKAPLYHPWENPNMVQGDRDYLPLGTCSMKTQIHLNAQYV